MVPHGTIWCLAVPYGTKSLSKNRKNGQQKILEVCQQFGTHCQNILEKVVKTYQKLSNNLNSCQTYQTVVKTSKVDKQITKNVKQICFALRNANINWI